MLGLEARLTSVKQILPESKCLALLAAADKGLSSTVLKGLLHGLDSHIYGAFFSPTAMPGTC